MEIADGGPAGGIIDSLICLVACGNGIEPEIGGAQVSERGRGGDVIG